jgi:MFS superfamily sulfate permease-like transporter
VLLFFLLLPAIYWSWKLWNDPAARIRIPAIANVVITVILLVMSYRIGDTAVQDFLQRAGASQAQSGLPHIDMNAWCQEKYGTSFDRNRGACVDNTLPAAK